MIATLANCGLKPCPELPLWVTVPLGIVGLAAIVVTLLGLFGKGRRR